MASQFCVRARCGLCNVLFVVEKDTLVGFVGSRDSAIWDMVVECQILVSGYEYSHRVSKFCMFRRSPGTCSVYDIRDPEMIHVHAECFQLFRRECPLEAPEWLDRIWVTAAWRHSYSSAATHHLPDVDVPEDDATLSLFREVASRLELPILNRLPSELLLMVWRYLGESRLGCCVAVASRARRMQHDGRDEDSDEAERRFIAHVLAWKRGNPMELIPSDKQADLPVIRLTMDAHGIRELERLPAWPRIPSGSVPRRYDDRIFALACAGDVRWPRAVRFKHDRLRLLSGDRKLTFDTWDTPTPPILDKKRIYISNIRYRGSQFRTIDLGRITGLTFLFSPAGIVGIHGHTPDQPFATRLVECLSAKQRSTVVWSYLPVAPGDCISEMRVRSPRNRSAYRSPPTPMPLSFVVRMRRAGQVFMGSIQARNTFCDFSLSQGVPDMFIYNFTERRESSVFAAIRAEQDGPQSDSPTTTTTTTDTPMDDDPFHRPWMDDNPLFPKAICSFAPLRNVVRARVFQSPETGRCRGLLLDYGTGDHAHQRAVGDCHLGVDPSVVYEAPATICIRYMSCREPEAEPEAEHEAGKRRRTIRVAFASASEHTHDKDETWLCSSMDGDLVFQCTSTETTIDVWASAEN